MARADYRNCPICGKPLVLQGVQNGYFYVCHGYGIDCNYYRQYDPVVNGGHLKSCAQNK